jgi:hypothetical protein
MTSYGFDSRKGEGIFLRRRPSRRSGRPSGCQELTTDIFLDTKQWKLYKYVELYNHQSLTGHILCRDTNYTQKLILLYKNNVSKCGMHSAGLNYSPMQSLCGHGKTLRFYIRVEGIYWLDEKDISSRILWFSQRCNLGFHLNSFIL